MLFVSDVVDVLFSSVLQVYISIGLLILDMTRAYTVLNIEPKPTKCLKAKIQYQQHSFERNPGWNHVLTTPLYLEVFMNFVSRNLQWKLGFILAQRDPISQRLQFGNQKSQLTQGMWFRIFREWLLILQIHRIKAQSIEQPPFHILKQKLAHIVSEYHSITWSGLLQV